MVKEYSVNIDGVPFTNPKSSGFSVYNEKVINLMRTGSEFFMYGNNNSGVIIDAGKWRETLDTNLDFVYPSGVENFTEIHGILLHNWEFSVKKSTKQSYKVSICALDAGGDEEVIAYYVFNDTVSGIKNIMLTNQTPYKMKSNSTLSIKVSVSYPEKGASHIVSGDIYIYYK